MKTMKTYRKIDIYVNGAYVCSTNQSKTLPEAVKKASADPFYHGLRGATAFPRGVITVHYA